MTTRTICSITLYLRSDQFIIKFFHLDIFFHGNIHILNIHGSSTLASIKGTFLCNFLQILKRYILEDARRFYMPRAISSNFSITLYRVTRIDMVNHLGTGDIPNNHFFMIHIQLGFGHTKHITIQIC